MQAISERSHVMELVQSLSDEQVRYVLGVIQSLPRGEGASTLRAQKKTYTEEDARDAFGLWKDREDCADVAEYARRVRRGRNFAV